MAQTSSAHEAKARFGESIRKVRAGQRIVISHRGREVAEIRPLETRPDFPLGDIESGGPRADIV